MYVAVWGNSRLQVFRGVAKGWAASSRWDPLHGGLDYLQVSTSPALVLFLASLPNAYETMSRRVEKQFFFTFHCNRQFLVRLFFRKKWDLMSLWKL